MMVFVSSPYGGKEENYLKACTYCKEEIKLYRNTPIAPHVLFHNVLSDEEDRDLGIKLGLKLLEKCDAVHVYGTEQTPGMLVEIEHALSKGIPVIFMGERSEEKYEVE